ncbi:recombinase family protein [Leuconostoc mesenteroides]|uniref:recombinase family protein n=1 Tax=Leuconostoc mesenteroides TaxID=1245 RepID=UPI00385D2BF4
MTVYGYARVSTAGQSLNEQKDTLKTAGADIIMSEKYSGTTTTRPQFEKLVHLVEPHDTLIVTKLDRFARNTREALNLIDSLLKEKIIIKVLNLGTIDNTSMGRMIVRTLLSVAEMERDMIIERTQAGKVFAKQHAQKSINWTIFIQLLRQHLRYDCDYKNCYSNLKSKSYFSD